MASRSSTTADPTARPRNRKKVEPDDAFPFVDLAAGDGAYDVYDDEPAPKRPPSRATASKAGGRTAAGTAKRAGATAPRARRKPGRIRGTIEALRRGWANPRTRAVWGLVTWALAAFLTGALVSGLISGAADYELVTEGVRVDAAGEA